MQPEDDPPNLRERTRQAVRAQLIDVALGLFVEQGYEATTVDEIARAAGMSKRSFFRYFGSKEDLVVGKQDGSMETFVARLVARPAAEPLWTALRRVFDYVVDYASDMELAKRMAVMDVVVASSESLRAAYIERIQRAQDRMAAVARDRAAAQGTPWAAGDPAPRAIVGAAFACLEAARGAAHATGDPLGPLLDRTMAALHPSHPVGQGRA